MIKIDTNTAINRHLSNLSNIVGHDVSSRYSYIISESDLTNAWLKMHNDLGYPLMVDSKYRRAIIYNKQGLEKQIQNMIVKCIEEAEKGLADLVAAEITAQLNSITQTTNGNIVIGGGNKSSNVTSMFATALGKGLVKGFFNILDDITIYDDNRRKRR